ncbi:hypothetical protein [Microbacterium sp. Mcb102]|uniref:hypothetical protein n=1 Tax=Microbacterium sp. Mcb102 TaxID=2926012 RepID=UPI0021C580B5|nr:hypothetical protein [Microbacterium sp. Mcb102]
MARKYEIGIAADTDGVEKAIANGIVDPLEEAEDAFDDLEKAAKGADLDKELEKAQDAAEDLSDELDETRDSLRRLKFGAQDVESGTKKSFGKASENVEEFKNEAAANFSEVTSSFNGEMDSILDLAQGTLGGLASGISGPLGIALGLAAAGIGLVVNGLVNGEEKAEELREQARQFAVEAVNAGQSTEAWLSGAQQIVDRIQELEQLKATDWRWFWEKDPTQLQKWVDGLKGAGRSLDEVEGFLASGADAQDEYRKSMQKARDAAMDEAEAIASTSALADEKAAAKIEALESEVAAYDDVLASIDQEMSTREEAAASAERQRDAGVASAQARMEAEQEAADAIAAAQDTVQASVTGAYDSMRSAATDYATTEDGALNIERWLTYTQEHAAAVATYQANLQAMKLTPEQWTNLMEMPEAQRTQWVAQFVALPENARQPYAAALNDLGKAGGSQASVAFDDSFDPNADVDIKVDTSSAESDLENVARKRTADIAVKTTGKSKAKADLDALARKRHATIDVRANTTPANNDVESWRRRQQSRPVYIEVQARMGGKQLT